MKYGFMNGSELLALTMQEKIPVSEIMIRNEMERSEQDRDIVWSKMLDNLKVMEESVRHGLTDRNAGGFLSRDDGKKLYRYAEEASSGSLLAEAAAAAMAVVEYNASMGRIVAAPTAGASGILPAVLLVVGRKKMGLTSEQLCRGLFTAGALGTVIARNASIAGASGGCQAETGSAAAMAAGALCELSGGTPAMVLDAAAFALKNCMGLICDPVGGLVECPCIARNAIGTANAVLSCDMVMSGIRSLIPFDETVSAMKKVGLQMHTDLKETAKGGVAATPTGKRLAEEILKN